jgi:hypothetical protein
VDWVDVLEAPEELDAPGVLDELGLLEGSLELELGELPLVLLGALG